MFERFGSDARAVVKDAVEEARKRGDRTVEAEHLLLACTVPDLDQDQIEALLDEEDAQALAAVGVARSDFDLPPRAPTTSTPSFGTSAKVALRQALAAARERGDRRIGQTHVALGVLAATEGRVPRALRLGGINLAELRGAIR